VGLSQHVFLFPIRAIHDPPKIVHEILEPGLSRPISYLPAVIYILSMPNLAKIPSVLSVLSTIPKFDLSLSPVLLRSSQMATQVINSDNVTPGGAIDIGQDQKLSDAKVTSADEDDELNHEIDPKEERAFV
jgi:hypothetical protein